MASEFDTETTIAEVALDRARVLAPIVLGAIVISLMASTSMHVELSRLVLAFNGASIAILGALNFLLLTRRVPAQRWRLVSMIVFWTPVLGTFLTQFSNHTAVLVSIVQLEMASAAIIPDSRLVVGSFVVANAMWIPLCLRDGGDSAGMFIAGTIGAQISAAIMQILMRRSFLQVHRLRHTEVENAAELARQLDELRASKAEQAKLFDHLQHAQRMDAVGTLAAGVAHDMNNVLASIMSMSNLLADAVEDEGHREDLEQIVQSAERGAELTRGLLAFSRRGQYRNEPIRFGELVHGVASLLRRTLPKSIDIIESGHLGDLCVRGDSSQLSQALVNLGLNAADAMSGAGTLELAAVIEDIDADEARALDIAAGRYIALRVVDTGIGMDAATRIRVFEPFFTTKPMGKGTGLGLALVWGAIQGHGGTVTVDSELGRGSTFTVHLPLSSERAPEVEVPTRRSRPVLARKASTVLVIDDEPTIRAATKRLLERLGHHVLTAGDGAEGLRVFDEADGAVDLVILDMGMPVMGGADCFERLRARSQVPVLIATGYALEEEAQALVARGAALLEKPFASTVLICEIERLIGSGSHSRGSRDVSEISPKPGAIVALRASQESSHERANESEDPGH